MENQGGNEAYDTEPRQEGGKMQSMFALMDVRYIKGIPGLLKALEAVSCGIHKISSAAESSKLFVKT